MKILLRSFALALLVALGFWLWVVLFPDPKVVINHRLRKLAELASFTPNESSFRRIANVERLGRLFSEDAQVTIDAPGEQHVFNGRNELMQAAIAAKGLGNGLSAQFVDVQIDLGPEKQDAVVDLTLKAKVKGDDDIIAQELKFTLKKIQDEWLITRVDTLKPIK